MFRFSVGYGWRIFLHAENQIRGLFGGISLCFWSMLYIVLKVRLLSIFLCYPASRHILEYLFLHSRGLLIIYLYVNRLIYISLDTVMFIWGTLY